MKTAGPKHRSLSRLLALLHGPLASGRLSIDARWRDNEEAVGVYATHEPGVSAFIFTYAQPEGCYGIELGYPDAQAVNAAGVQTAYELLEFDQALALLCTHFDLSEHA